MVEFTEVEGQPPRNEKGHPEKIEILERRWGDLLNKGPKFEKKDPPRPPMKEKPMP